MVHRLCVSSNRKLCEGYGKRVDGKKCPNDTNNPSRIFFNCYSGVLDQAFVDVKVPDDGADAALL